MIFLALLHYPVLNRRGETIVSAVTNLDIHDISRAARTFGVEAFYVVTPLEEQRLLVKELARHWLEGAGASINPDRRDALGLVRVCHGLQAVRDEISLEFHARPVIYATTARTMPGQTSWRALRERTIGYPEEDLLLLFGTASGLHPEVIEEADGVLEPITGRDGYNHLSVRSAVAIALDRLTGRW